jgi:hypothetical protein
VRTSQDMPGRVFAVLYGAFRGLSSQSSHYQREGRNVIPADDKAARSVTFKDAKQAITAIRRARCVPGVISIHVYQPGAAGRRPSAVGGGSNLSKLHNFRRLCP